MIFLEYQNLKTFFAKGYVPNWSQEVFVIKTVKNTVSWAYVIGDFKGKEIVGTFYEKELQKTNQKEFRVEKVIKRNGDKLYVKWKGYDKSFNSWIDKKDMIEYYTERKSLGRRVKFELGLYNYAAKTDFKSATSVATSKFAKKVDLASLKSDVDLRNLKMKIDKLDVDNIVPVPVYLSKLSDVVKK